LDVPDVRTKGETLLSIVRNDKHSGASGYVAFNHQLKSIVAGFKGTDTMEQII
jgi:hypothetical protein